MRFTIFSVMLLVLILVSCKKKDLRTAKDALEGTWKVTEIFSATGMRMTNGIDITNEETETGDLGDFVFTSDQVDYVFTRQGVEQRGNVDWTLTREKVNSGFTKVEVYTLSFDDFIFDCAFGDQTSDAEKNATDIKLTFETEAIGDYSTFVLTMKKE